MSEITPGDLIRSSWLDDEPTPAPEGEALRIGPARCADCGAVHAGGHPPTFISASPVGPAPEGEAVAWRTVPVEPTEAMMKAFWQAFFADGPKDNADCYAAMLAASPVVPVGREQRQRIAAIIDANKYEAWTVDRANQMADAILAALRPTDTGWRDIATAPKDGTPVDLFLTYDPTNDTCKAFTGGRVPDAHYDNGWVAMSANPDGEDEYYEVEVPGIVTATHWMPSPDAPTDTGRG